MAIKNHNQFLFPETAMAATPTLRIQYARALADPTATAIMPFDFHTVNNNDPFDFATINTGILTTFVTNLSLAATSTSGASSSSATSVTRPVMPFIPFTPLFPGGSSADSTPASTHIPGATLPDPAWPGSTSSAATPTPTNHTDLTDLHTQNEAHDIRKVWITVSAIVVIALIISVCALVCHYNGSRRWRRKKSTTPVERMKMELPRYQASSDGLHAALSQPGDASACNFGTTGGSWRAPPPAYPGRTSGNPYRTLRMEYEIALARAHR